MLATSSAGSIRVSTGSSACSLNHFCTSPDSMLTSPDSSTVMRTSTTLSLAASSPSGNEAAATKNLYQRADFDLQVAVKHNLSPLLLVGLKAPAEAGNNSVIVYSSNSMIVYSSTLVHTFKHADPLQQHKK